MTIIFIALGGFLGAISRFWTGNILQSYTKLPKRTATLMVNLFGSFLLGMVIGLNVKTEINLFFGVGFLGSFTTFSTFIVENMDMLKKKSWKNTLLYILVSIVGGIILAFIGMSIALK